jgi:GAF domain-containing protein
MMSQLQVPLHEAERLVLLREYHILDTPPEAVYDDIVSLAATICGTPIALVSFVDEDRQWFKARYGFTLTGTPRDVAFCARAILDTKPLIVPDAQADPRYADNPLVTGASSIRFYAGAPLTSVEGHNLGTLCVMDREPRALLESHVRALESLARLVVGQLELRRMSALLADAVERGRILSGLLPICAYCKRIRDDGDYWREVENYVRSHAAVEFSHGICPQCFAAHFPAQPPA